MKRRRERGRERRVGGRQFDSGHFFENGRGKSA